jgi:hypothetical protein
MHQLRALYMAAGLAVGISAATTASATGCEAFEKQVSVDGGQTWLNADVPASAAPFGGDAEYRLILNNCSSTKRCDNTSIRDDTLKIFDVLVGDGVLAPLESVIVTSTTLTYGDGSTEAAFGFENLDQGNRCVPMNLATETTTLQGHAPETFSDPAYLDCDPPPPCEEFEKQVSVDGGLTWLNADDPGSAPSLPFGGDTEYRLILNNCHTTKLCENTTIRDDILELLNVPVGDGVLAAQESVIVTSTTLTYEDKNGNISTQPAIGFANLDQPGRCIPMNTAIETTTLQGHPP